MVSDIPARDGKMANHFYSVHNAIIIVIQHKFLQHKENLLGKLWECQELTVDAYVRVQEWEV